MSTFTQVLNPIIGTSQWNVQSENYDYVQEIARAAFADMLHDTERNQKYQSALKKAIETIHRRGEKANVLDIGTGTGLLSMMAVKLGADSVVACEAFEPMADCAVSILEKNGVRDRITLIKKRSTDVIVGEDMKSRANILVTEVFDTDLIGEGAIPTFQHANKHLLTEDCIVVPHAATIYAQIVESPWVHSWNRPKMLANLDGEVLLRPPKSILDCPGSLVSHDLQMSQISRANFTPLTEPVPIFEFAWSGSSIETRRNSKKTLKPNCDGVAHAVFVWWDLKMDPEGEILLSCAPHWAHPEGTLLPWRDHWMQAIYYLPKVLTLRKNQEFQLFSNHNEFLLWFNAAEKGDIVQANDPPGGNHSFYSINSRTRIGQLNDHIRNKKFLRILEESITKESTVLAISDGSIIGLAVSALGAKKLYLLQENRFHRDVMAEYIETNNLSNVELISSLDELTAIETLTHVIAEPHFVTSILPWDNLYFGTLLRRLRPKLRDDVVVLPKLGKIYGMAVEFVDLHKIRVPLVTCEGFDMEIFDEMIDNATKATDAYVEAQPLWEYPCRALSLPVELMSIDLMAFEKNIDATGGFDFNGVTGVCNGVAVWIDWWLDGSPSPKSIISTGPSAPVELGEPIKWDFYTRQGVHLFPHPQTLTPDTRPLKWTSKFNYDKGEILFQFETQ